MTLIHRTNPEWLYDKVSVSDRRLSSKTLDPYFVLSPSFGIFSEYKSLWDTGEFPRSNHLKDEELKE